MFIPWSMVALPLVGLVAAKKGYRRLTAHGAARWGDENDMAQAGMLGKEGPVVGVIRDGEEKGIGRAVRMVLSRRVSHEQACRAVLRELKVRRKNGKPSVV